MAQPRLVVTNRDGNRVIPIEGDRVTLGRDPDNVVQVSAGDVSGHHAEIIRRDEAFILHDLGSQSGTYLNDRSVRARTLAHGDRIRLGSKQDVQVVFLAEEDGLAAVSAPGPAPPSATELHLVADLLESLRALGSGRVLEEVLALVLDSAIKVTGTQRGFIMLVNAAGELELRMARALGGVTLSGKEFERSRVAERVFATGEPEGVADLHEAGVAGQHLRTVRLRIRSVLCVPLRLALAGREGESGATGTRSMGVLYLDSRVPTERMSTMTIPMLESLAAEAAMAIENARLYRDALEKARTDEELRIAAGIQQALLPPLGRASEAFDVAGEMIPCRAIGGDFLDYFDLSNGRMGLALADVVGKGPPAAILAGLIQGMLIAEAQLGDDPSTTLDRMNEALMHRSMDGRFATFFYAVASPDGRMISCNAGHTRPFLLTSEGSVRRLSRGGTPLGAFPCAYQGEQTSMSPGDMLVAFSDGVSEAMDGSEELFGEERIMETLRGAGGLDAFGVVQRIIGAVKDFAGECPQADDITVLAVRYLGPPGEHGSSPG